MGKSAWESYINSKKASSSYLANEIHSKITQRYLMTEDYKQDEKDAAELQKILYELKNYEKKKSQGNTIFDIEEYNAFVDSYGRVVDNKNFKFSNFLRKGGGRSLELALGRIATALKDVNDKFIGQQKEKKELKNYSAKLITGGNYNIIEIPVEDITNNLTQTVLNNCGVATNNWYKSEIKKGTSNNVAYVNPKQSKIDVYTNNIEISLEMEINFPNLAKFAKLYSQSTITAKNYKEETYKKSGLKLGNTNMFTILYQTLKYNNFFINNDDALNSFIIALYNRKDNKLVNSTPNTEDSNIESHFNHMQTIFELTGAGQNYYLHTGQKQYELNQLNDLLRQGAKFLIYNQWDSDKIIVQSTKAILYQRLQNELTKNSKFNYYRF